MQQRTLLAKKGEFVTVGSMICIENELFDLILGFTPRENEKVESPMTIATPTTNPSSDVEHQPTTDSQSDELIVTANTNNKFHTRKKNSKTNLHCILHDVL